MKEFYSKESGRNKSTYTKLLKIVGSLSNLFSDSSNPYLYYRAMENIFCKAFGANNLSRGDVSIDASKGKIGMGLKTFIHGNGNTFQKIAEFNKESYLIRDLNPSEIVEKVSQMRNERLQVTKRICDVDDMIYHLITRKANNMSVFEENMDEIGITNINSIKKNQNTIHFTDGLHEYNFSLSKNTLMKRFYTDSKSIIHSFDVNILVDPFEFLLSKIDTITKTFDQEILEKEYIILPLYSPRTGKVQEKSGLNMWNASGRRRDDDEVYIPIPSIIHEKAPSFFSNIYTSVIATEKEFHKTEAFDVKLPNQKILNMRVSQQGGKALQSNPNKALGEWLLRDVLKLKRKELLTKEKIDSLGIDSVKLSKMSDGSYTLDFLDVGSYEEYLEDLL